VPKIIKIGQCFTERLKMKVALLLLDHSVYRLIQYTDLTAKPANYKDYRSTRSSTAVKT